MYVCVPRVSTEAREGLHPLDQKLRRVVSHQAGAGNQTQVLLTAESSLLLPTKLLKWATDNLLETKRPWH